jgi:hypothetical protein
MMSYSKDGIMAQCWVAFGQGSGSLRVSQEAAIALQSQYYGAITNDLLDKWDGEAVQILERMRAIGRLAAHLAAGRGDTRISAVDVAEATASVQRTSDTERCPPDTGFP